MVLDIVKYDNKVLRAKGKRIDQADDEIRRLAADMLDTMYAARGLGLAAQQVGVPLQLTVVDVKGIKDRPSAMFIDGKPVDYEKHMPLTLLNPDLTLSAEREVGSEGCLSFPDLSADIARASRVKVRADLLDGGEIVFEATGLLARAIQHETDHLNGVLFIDRMNSATKVSLSGRLKRLQKETAVNEAEAARKKPRTASSAASSATAPKKPQASDAT